MRYAKIALFAMVLALFALPAYSHQGGNVDIEIISDNGDEFLPIPYKNYKTGGTHLIKKYLEARREENYSIVIRNNTAERVGVVVAVDGRNIITGRKSFLKNNEMMYIVYPYGSTKLEGWRTNQDAVHRFYFTDVSDSYAVRTFGDTSAMGVIAVAVFREKEQPRILYEKELKKEKAPAPSSGAPSSGASREYKSDSAGTGFGDETYSPVVKVEFEPENIPSKKILVKYEWRDVLCKKRILKCWREGKNRLWDEGEYAPYPPGYIER